MIADLQEQFIYEQILPAHFLPKIIEISNKWLDRTRTQKTFSVLTKIMGKKDLPNWLYII